MNIYIAVKGIFLSLAGIPQFKTNISKELRAAG
jgi:hypothetical protein